MQDDDERANFYLEEKSICLKCGGFYPTQQIIDTVCLICRAHDRVGLVVLGDDGIESTNSISQGRIQMAEVGPEDEAGPRKEKPCKTTTGDKLPLLLATGPCDDAG